MSPPKQGVPRRIHRPTLLLVGEGDTEVAFLKHLNPLYCRMRPWPSIRNAHGGGPSSVIQKAIKLACIPQYDFCVVLLDTDKPWPDEDKASAARQSIHLVGMTPCIEGLFLDILKKEVLKSARKCKAALESALPSFDKLDPQSYVSYFGKAVLKEARTRISELDRLLKFFEGQPQK